MNQYRVTILCTDPRHPVNAWLDAWMERERSRADITLRRDVADVEGGDFLFLVSCHQIVGPNIRARFQHVLVLHASDLPKGRGMSPHVWQVIEGADRITLSMLNAEDALDSGDIWQQRTIDLDGTELYDEINAKLFDAEVELMSWALDHCDTSTARPQTNDQATYYRRRTPEDSRIDPERPLVENFDLLRVADPSRFPAFFEYRGQQYVLKVEKAKK